MPFMNVAFDGVDYYINKTKDQLWSLNAAQPEGDVLFKMELFKKNQQFQAKTLCLDPWYGDPCLGTPVLETAIWVPTVWVPLV